MLKPKKRTGGFRLDDFNRAVITDTAPFEVPIVFSNDGLYKNLSRKDVKSHFSKFIAELFKPDRYSIPYRYNIVKSTGSARQLSLLHPSAQIDVCEFYREYEDLICYYCSLSSFTIRAPRKVGSSFFIPSKISEKNKYKNSFVDTTDIDKLVRNPASYFAYRGYDRLYKFFNSGFFLELEKRFCHLTSLDVSKCFDNIYTHSIAWALKDIETAKQNISANHFGSRFDSLMQKMNYNETNGICIGAEVSRIFAELILGRIDQDVELALLDRDLRRSRDYEIRRYVDNYYVFTNNIQVSRRIQAIITNSLREYKLHLNESKIDDYERPFYTVKSKIIDDSNDSLESLFLRVIKEHKIGDIEISRPRAIVRYDAVFKSFIRDIKSRCVDSDVKYEDISSYLISSFSNRLLRLIEDLNSLSGEKAYVEDDYVKIVVLLLELSFFFYAMSPTVASSLKLSKSIIVACKGFKSHFQHRLPFLQERIVHWTAQIMRNPRLIEIARDHDAIPIEVLNILIAMHDVAADHTFSESAFRQIFDNVSELRYFSLMSCLFIIRDNDRFSSLRGELINHITNILILSPSVRISAHDAHLLLDTLACPFIAKADREAIYRDAAFKLGLGKISNAEAAQAVAECEESPWFINWQGVELLSLITKKELSSVY